MNLYEFTTVIDPWGKKLSFHSCGRTYSSALFNKVDKKLPDDTVMTHDFAYAILEHIIYDSGTVNVVNKGNIKHHPKKF